MILVKLHKVLTSLLLFISGAIFSLQFSGSLKRATSQPSTGLVLFSSSLEFKLFSVQLYVQNKEITYNNVLLHDIIL